MSSDKCRQQGHDFPSGRAILQPVDTAETCSRCGTVRTVSRRGRVRYTYPAESDERLGVRDAARTLGLHENTVRNWAKYGRIRPYSQRPLRFTAEEVERVQRNMAGRNLADVLRGNATVGILVVLRLPDALTPEEAVAEVRRGIEFGQPQVGLHFVVPDARKDENN